MRGFVIVRPFHTGGARKARLRIVAIALVRGSGRTNDQGAAG